MDVVTLAAAKAASRASVAALTPALTPTAITSTSTTPTAADDFETGSTLTGRSTSTGGLAWTIVTGTWNISGGQLAASAGTNNLQAYFTVSGLARCTVLATVVPFMSSGSVYANPAIMFRRVDANNFFYLQADPHVNIVSLYRVTSGTHNLLMEFPTTLTSGSPVDLRVDLLGPDITPWVSGVEQVTVTDTQGLSSNTVGVRQGSAGSPSPAKWNNLTVLPYQSTVYNWPRFPYDQATVVISRGADTTWDDNDINNPNVTWDPVNLRWQLDYSGYDGNGSSLQKVGLAYATSPAGPWTKEDLNPVYNDITAGGGDMNGGMVYLDGGWIYVYQDNASISIARATTSTGTWTKQAGILTAGTAGTYDDQGCYDAFLRVRQDGITLECWYGGQSSVNSGKRSLCYAVSTDGGYTWAKNSSNPVIEHPAWCGTHGKFSEASVYVPSGKEGREMLVFADVNGINANTDRFVAAFLTTDAGVTWHAKIVARPPVSGSITHGSFDSFPLYDNGTLYLFHTAAGASTSFLNGQMVIACRSARWNPASLVVAVPS